MDIKFVLDPGKYPLHILSHTEVAKFYKSLDVSICASIAEGCSNTVLESLACGIPVITAPVGIYKELEHLSFVTVCKRTVDGIFEALDGVLKPKIDTHLGLLEYTWLQIAKQYEGVYNAILGNA